MKLINRSQVCGANCEKNLTVIIATEDIVIIADTELP